MKYTDEEFFGNTQNIVSEGGELVPIESEQHHENYKYGKLILSTFVKTLICVFGSLFYFVAVMVSLVPKTAIKIFDYIGAENASLSCYVRIYEKEKTLSSLYNVVQKSISNKDHKKSSKYIKELQGKNDYVDFCLKVNQSVVMSLDKEYIAFLGDLDGYLVAQNIVAEYRSNNKIEALNIAVSDLENNNIYSFGLSSYIECLVADKTLSEGERNQKVLELVNSEGLISRVNLRLDDVLNINEQDSIDVKIMKTYTALKIEKVLYELYDASGDLSLKETSRKNIEELQTKYNSLIK